MARKPKVSNEIPEAKIRQAIWMLKTGKTKKSICELLGIAYNTKRVEAIISEFKDKELRIAEFRKKRSKTPFTDEEKAQIVNAYTSGETQSGIAALFFTTPARIKSVIIEMNAPIRARSKKGEAQVDHIIQDLDIIFKKGDRVFIPAINSFAKVKEVFDEEWIDYYRQPSRRRYVEFPELEKMRKIHGPEYEGKIDVHYNIYWQYDNEQEWKEEAIIDKIKNIETMIEETGREYYEVFIEGDYGHFRMVKRADLIPVITK